MPVLKNVSHLSRGFLRCTKQSSVKLEPASSNHRRRGKAFKCSRPALVIRVSRMIKFRSRMALSVVAQGVRARERWGGDVGQAAKRRGGDRAASRPGWARRRARAAPRVATREKVRSDKRTKTPSAGGRQERRRTPPGADQLTLTFCPTTILPALARAAGSGACGIWAVA